MIYRQQNQFQFNKSNHVAQWECVSLMCVCETNIGFWSGMSMYHESASQPLLHPPHRHHHHPPTWFITAHNEVGARLYFHRYLWFCSQGVCLSACWDTTPPDQAPPDQAPPRPGTPQTRHPPPPGPSTPPPGAEHAGRYGQHAGILLECNLVLRRIPSFQTTLKIILSSKFRLFILAIDFSWTCLGLIIPQDGSLLISCSLTCSRSLTRPPTRLWRECEIRSNPNLYENDGTSYSLFIIIQSQMGFQM